MGCSLRTLRSSGASAASARTPENASPTESAVELSKGILNGREVVQRAKALGCGLSEEERVRCRGNKCYAHLNQSDYYLKQKHSK